MRIPTITNRSWRACCGAAALFIVTSAVAQKVPDIRLNTNIPGSSQSERPQIDAS